MNKILVFLYSLIKKKPYHLKQNDAIHYVTYVTFCITTEFLINFTPVVSSEMFMTIYWF